MMVHYLWLHSLVIAIVSAWFLYRRSTKWLNPKAKLVSLRVFQASVVSSLVEAHKRNRGRPSLESTLTSVPTKLFKVQSTPTDVRKDGIDHFTECKEKRERCRQCLDDYAYISCRKCKCMALLSQKKKFFSSYYGHY